MFTVASHTIGTLTNAISTGLASIGFSTANHSLLSDLKASKQTINKQKSKIQKLQAETKALATEHKKIASKTSSIIRKIKRRTAKTIAASTAAVPLESIPFTGAATILSVTTAEIYAACKDMEDLSKLEILHGITTDETERNAVCGTSIPTVKELREYWKDKWKDIATAFREWWNHAF